MICCNNNFAGVSLILQNYQLAYLKNFSFKFHGEKLGENTQIKGKSSIAKNHDTT